MPSSTAMDAWDLIIHWANFLVPAFAVGTLVACAGAVRRTHGSRGAWSWPVQAAVNALLGSAALALGLWFFGRDGKMLSYAGLVLAVALAQWWGGRPRAR